MVHSSRLDRQQTEKKTASNPIEAVFCCIGPIDPYFFLLVGLGLEALVALVDAVLVGVALVGVALAGAAGVLATPALLEVDLAGVLLAGAVLAAGAPLVAGAAALALVFTGAALAAAAFGALATPALVDSILNNFEPHTPQTPRDAGRPSLAVMTSSFLIGRFSLHLTQ